MVNKDFHYYYYYYYYYLLTYLLTTFVQYPSSYYARIYAPASVILRINNVWTHMK